jgi:hypothetical protein
MGSTVFIKTKFMQSKDRKEAINTIFIFILLWGIIYTVGGMVIPKK